MRQCIACHKIFPDNPQEHSISKFYGGRIRELKEFNDLEPIFCNKCKNSTAGYMKYTTAIRIYTYYRDVAYEMIKDFKCDNCKYFNRFQCDKDCRTARSQKECKEFHIDKIKFLESIEYLLENVAEAPEFVVDTFHNLFHKNVDYLLHKEDMKLHIKQQFGVQEKPRKPRSNGLSMF